MTTNLKLIGIAYAVAIISISILLSSCGSAKSCHVKGYYVSKSIKKAQHTPRSY